MKNPLHYIAFLCLIFIIVNGCNPAKKHKTLAFFFDGVPAPYADTTLRSDSLEVLPVKTLVDTSGPLVSSLFASNHMPYKESQCTECHDQNDLGKLLRSEPALCYSCHMDFNQQFERLHGPVDVGFCSTCHHPHQSKHEKLLIAGDDELCMSCHSGDRLEETRSHKEIGDQSCMNCHDPHGIVEPPLKPKAIPGEP